VPKLRSLRWKRADIRDSAPQGPDGESPWAILTILAGPGRPSPETADPMPHTDARMRWDWPGPPSNAPIPTSPFHPP